MKIEGNMNEVKDIMALPSGAYNVTVLQEPKLIASKEKKTPGIEFTLTFTDPGTEIAPGVARTMRHTVYRSAAMGWQHPGMKEVCVAFGVPMENPDTIEFVNRSCRVAISTVPYEDRRTKEAKVRNEIDVLSPLV